MFKVEKNKAFKETTVKDIFRIVDDIDFSPPYQRYGNIWSLEKKQLLIDSIINAYDIPKIYLHYITELNSNINKSGKSHAIIDGKQRLQAIFEFIRGEFALSDDFIYEKNPEIVLSSKTYSELSNYSEIRYDFDNFELDVVYIITDDIEKIEEFFYRLNEGQPLNNAEKRNRIVGGLNDAIKTIISNNVFFTSKVILNNKRLQYQDLCLKLIYTEYNNKLVSFDKKALDVFVQNNRTPSDEVKNAILKTNDNLEVLNQIFEENDPLLKLRSLIPVYYYFITRDITKYDIVRTFLQHFELVRINNRLQKDANPILLEFDRQNQQGVHRQKSLHIRYSILSKYYSKYLEIGNNLDWDTQVPIEDLDLEQND